MDKRLADGESLAQGHNTRKGSQVEATCAAWGACGLNKALLPRLPSGCGYLKVEIHKAAAHPEGGGTRDILDDNYI